MYVCSILIRWFFVGFTIFENESAQIGISMKEKNGQYAPDQANFVYWADIQFTFHDLRC